MNNKSLETKRLILRELNEGDFASLYEVLSDSDIMKHYPYTFDGKTFDITVENLLNYKHKTKYLKNGR